MNGFYYFPQYDSMIQANYSHQTNSFLYYSNKKLSGRARRLIEKSIVENAANEDARYGSADLYYLGINLKLIQKLREFHSLNSIRQVGEKVKIVNNSLTKWVDNLAESNQIN